MSYPLTNALITVLIMTFGLITNIIVLTTVRKMSSMRNSFGIITKNQAVCNILMCLLFLIFVGPLQLSDFKPSYNSSRFVGLTSMIIYEASAQLNFLNSINRFFAVYTIFLYDRIFSTFKTYIMINFVYFISISMCFVFYEFLGCYLYFDPKSWIFSYPESEHCTNLTWYCDFVFNIVLVVSTLFLNLLAAYKARKLHQRIASMDQNMMSVQRQRDLNFIRQSFFQGLSMCVALVFYRITAPWITNEVLLFLDASLWAFMLAFEGTHVVCLRSRLALYQITNLDTDPHTKFLKEDSNNASFLKNLKWVYSTGQKDITFSGFQYKMANFEQLKNGFQCSDVFEIL